MKTRRFSFGPLLSGFYNCKIVYIEGKKNVCADLLSPCSHDSGYDNDDRAELSGPYNMNKTF